MPDIKPSITGELQSLDQRLMDHISSITKFLAKHIDGTDVGVSVAPTGGEVPTTLDLIRRLHSRMDKIGELMTRIHSEI